MGLYLSDTGGEESKWAVWRIEETLEELEARIPEKVRKTDPLLSQGVFAKKEQRMAVRALLQELFPEGAPIAYIGKRPILRNSSSHVSITHDPDFVAVQITSGRIPAGIDLQKQRPKQLERIAHRFLNEKERAWIDRMPYEERIPCLNIMWCAKEAMFKVCGGSLRDSMHVAPFQKENEGRVEAETIPLSQSRKGFELGYRAFGEHHLVHILDADFI